MKAIHAVNALLWHPSEQAQNHKRTDKPTDYYTRGRPRTSGNLEYFTLRKLPAIQYMKVRIV